MIISSAFAQAAPSGDPGYIGLLPIVLMFVLLYFLMIRPQMKRAKEAKAMIEALQKGDEVITAGGVLGRITKLSDGYVSLEIAPNTRNRGAEVRRARPAAQRHDQKHSVVNRYPTWGYALIALAVIAAFLYTLPNFFGESPAVQVSSGKATVKVDAAVMARVEETLKKASIDYTGAVLDQTSVRVRLADTDTQLKARDIIDRALNPDPGNPTYIVALNLLPASPNWLTAMRALPMYLGLDLRGGVHFLLQVDMQAAITKRLESLAADLRTQLREKNIRHGGITREGQTVRVRFRDAATRDAARAVMLDAFPDLAVTERGDGQDLLLVELAQARGGEAHPGIRAASRTSPRCTTASTSSASPSR